jgi:2'-hydroxyisoflavone reductase
MDRRRFVAAVVAAGAASVSRHSRADAALRLLVLGGTRFIGIHATRLAIERGHRVTLFNRGKTNASLFPQLERLKGDRNGDVGALAGRTWDAVIDDSGFFPRAVRLTGELLAPNVRQYVFISTISVYAGNAGPNSESSPLARIADETVEKVDGETYGPLKALCEQAAELAMPGRVTVLRPGLIVGPEDNTDRFTYWPARAARGGDFLTPNSPSDAIQYIDARDLARFTLDAIERGIRGTFNVISAPGKLTIGDLVTQSVDAAKRMAKPASPPRPVWVPTDFLEAQKVQAWSDMPVWVPETGDNAGFAHTSTDRAQRAGLNIRPLHETVRDTLAWHLGRPQGDQAQLKAGITTEREREVLAAWSRTQTHSG